MRPVIEACMSLEKTICARNSMQSFEVECIVTFFDAVRNHGILQKGLSGPMEAYSETFSSFKDAITLIVMWYKSFHLQFVQAFERVVVASETAAKIVRYITSSMTTLSPEVVRKDLAEATDKLSQLIFKLKDLISLRVAIYFPVLLDFEIPKDLTLGKCFKYSNVVHTY